MGIVTSFSNKSGSHILQESQTRDTKEHGNSCNSCSKDFGRIQLRPLSVFTNKSSQNSIVYNGITLKPNQKIILDDNCAGDFRVKFIEYMGGRQNIIFTTGLSVKGNLVANATIYKGSETKK